MTRNTEPLSPISYVSAIVASCVAFALTLVMILEFKYPNLERVGAANVHPVVVAMFFCAILGAISAAVQPAKALPLAILSSSMFWGFFLVIFACFLFEGNVDMIPLLQASLVMSSALVSAALVGWFVNRIRHGARR